MLPGDSSIMLEFLRVLKHTIRRRPAKLELISPYGTSLAYLVKDLCVQFVLYDIWVVEELCFFTGQNEERLCYSPEGKIWDDVYDILKVSRNPRLFHAEPERRKPADLSAERIPEYRCSMRIPFRLFAMSLIPDLHCTSSRKLFMRVIPPYHIANLKTSSQ